MEEELKDYAPLYLGCQVLDEQNVIRVLRGVDIHGCCTLSYNNVGEETDIPIGGIQLLLRPISDMTDEEAAECGNLDYDFSSEPDLNIWNWKDFDTLNSSNQFIYLLSKHFDLFGLIESGLAIDKTTLK
jgi:hypothetical protein